MRRLVFWMIALPAMGGLASSATAVEPVFSKYGVGTIINPINKPHPSQEAVLPPASERDQVYIFGVNGLNPLCLGNFNGLCSYLKEIGYKNTFFAQMYTVRPFYEDIRELKKKRCCSKVVVIGYSFGADIVRNMVNQFKDEGIEIDMLIYLGGDTIKNDPRSFPPNIKRLVNIRGNGAMLFGGSMNGEPLAGAENYLIEKKHILLPSQAETLRIIRKSLSEL
jgi:hypothetical protein